MRNQQHFGVGEGKGKGLPDGRSAWVWSLTGESLGTITGLGTGDGCSTAGDYRGITNTVFPCRGAIYGYHDPDPGDCKYGSSNRWGQGLG